MVVIIDLEDARDLEPTGGDYCWVNDQNKQLVPLRRITMQELVDGVRARYPNGRIMHAIYGALNTTPFNRQKTADKVWVTTDAYLANLVAVAEGAYKPLVFQLQLANPDRGNESPPPYDWAYFAENGFVPVADPYDRVASDSDNDLYLIMWGRRKAKSLPRSDHGFEHEKAKCRRKLGEFCHQLEKIKGCHRAFKGPKLAETIDSDDQDMFSWIRFVNP